VAKLQGSQPKEPFPVETKKLEGDVGLVYLREDLGPDGTHPADSGREKVAKLLLEAESPMKRSYFGYLGSVFTSSIWATWRSVWPDMSSSH
jgi:hypothetical protein